MWILFFLWLCTFNFLAAICLIICGIILLTYAGVPKEIRKKSDFFETLTKPVTDVAIAIPGVVLIIAGILLLIRAFGVWVAFKRRRGCNYKASNRARLELKWMVYGFPKYHKSHVMELCLRRERILSDILHHHEKVKCSDEGFHAKMSPYAERHHYQKDSELYSVPTVDSSELLSDHHHHHRVMHCNKTKVDDEGAILHHHESSRRDRKHEWTREATLEESTLSKPEMLSTVTQNANCSLDETDEQDRPRVTEWKTHNNSSAQR